MIIVFQISFFIFLFIVFYFITLFFWLCWVFIAVHGLSVVVLSRLLIAVVSLVAEHKL